MMMTRSATPRLVCREEIIPGGDVDTEGAGGRPGGGGCVTVPVTICS